MVLNSYLSSYKQGLSIQDVGKFVRFLTPSPSFRQPSALAKCPPSPLPKKTTAYSQLVFQKCRALNEIWNLTAIITYKLINQAIRGDSQNITYNMYFFEHFDIVTISTDKNTFLIAILKKLTLDNIFIKVKKKKNLQGWHI